MKKHLHNSLRALFLSLAVLLSMPMLAEQVEIDGINYDLNADAKQATVIKKSSGEYTGEVVIPESVAYNGYTYSVISIPSSAFSYCSGLTSVTIPNSVTSIGEGAFRSCSGLTSVHITDIAAWCNIYFMGLHSNPLNYAHHLYLNGEEVKDLVIPNSVTSIKNYAFEGCSGLTSVTIPNSVTSIGNRAFSSCSGLTSVTIPNSVTSIVSSAFSGCDGLTSVTIPNSVTSIGNTAFNGCHFVKENFVNNSSLSAEENNYWGAKLHDYETEEGLLIDSTSVVYCRRNAEIVTIPNSVTSIGENAFSYCFGLTSVTIGNSVTSIGEKAFLGCSGLTSVTIPNSVTSIGARAFSGCSALTSVTIGNSVMSIGEDAFYKCDGLTSVTIPNSVTNIGAGAFSGSSGLTSVTIPNSVTSIGARAFSGCSGLTSVTIPNSVTSIGSYAFSSCSGLTSVTIGNSVTSIGDYAFSGCDGLTSVTIPNSVTSIGESTFEECHFVKENFVNNSSLSAEENNYWGAKLHDYETEEGLLIDSTSVVYCRRNAEIVTIPNSVTSIGDDAFYECFGLTSVTIPNSVTSIGDDAFYRCSGLTSVTIPNSVTSIGEYTFYLCSGLTSVTIPNSVTSIGPYAFYECSGLTSVTIGNSVTSIGKRAFYLCSGLTSVTIGNSVTSIGEDAFYNCDGLTSVTIPNSVKSIGRYAFKGCSGLTSVTIGNSVTSIGEDAFNGCMLQTIVCKAIEPAGISSICNTNMYNHTQMYVPEGAYWDYAFSNWGSFIRIKEMAMDTEDLELRKAYMIADATGRNFSVYDSAKGSLVNIGYTHALDEESEGTCWAVLKNAGTSHLYNIGAKKYGTVAEDGALTLSDAPVGIDIVSTEDGLSINGKPCMFVLNNNISFDATGIDEQKGENGSLKSAVYDLSGRRVQKAQKGVFIQNGKVMIQ